MNVIPVDMSKVISAVVMSDPVPSLYDGKQRTNFDGVPLWDLDVTVAVSGAGASVLKLRVALASAPKVEMCQPVTLSGLRARVWEMNGRHGVAWSVETVAPLGATPPAGNPGKREN
ncbi:hypothetical protein [Pseudofrankia sp. DC12]|uniref:hypothetical protein n=1 Tax=Pseudofrankia sp. DC12 TaxID=683315 RepID=UPI0005F7F657|nr:hypothetical protein [Pseudofrankia sp. DC12]